MLAAFTISSAFRSSAFSRRMSNSPFRPGFSRMPLVFGGHENIIRDFENVFENYDLGKKRETVHICS